MTSKDRETLLRLQEMPEPRHLFTLPAWISPDTLDHLIEAECITFSHLQRTGGMISLIMSVELTDKAHRVLQNSSSFKDLAFKTSLAGASFIAMSAALLYLA